MESKGKKLTPTNSPQYQFTRDVKRSSKYHPAALTSYRTRKSPKGQVYRSFSQRYLTIWAVLAASLLVILFLSLLSFSSHPKTLGAAKSLLSKSGSTGEWPQINSEKFEKHTDKYIPLRDDEILGSWDANFGLEIDTWDPRTHDPRLNPSDYGALVEPKPQEKKYFLSVVVFNRVFKEDKFNISLVELRQWLEYMKYAGVDHVFWYDTAHSADESQEHGLRPYSKKGFLTYHRFHSLFPGNMNAGYHFEQDQSELHCLNEYGASTEWLLVVDVDEYVFMPKDTTPGFLNRYLHTYQEKYKEVSQLLLQCLFFVGHPKKQRTMLLIEKYRLRRPETEGVSLSPISHMKTIIKPASCQRVYRHNPHLFEMRTGKTVALPAAVVRLNHYHGPRANDFKPDTAEYVSGLVEDSSIQPIADELHKLIRKKFRMSIFHS